MSMSSISGSASVSDPTPQTYTESELRESITAAARTLRSRTVHFIYHWDTVNSTFG